MAIRTSSSSSLWISPLSIFFPRGDTLLCILALSFLLQSLIPSSLSSPDFEGFSDDVDEDENLVSLDLTTTTKTTTTTTTLTPPSPSQSDPESHHGPPESQSSISSSSSSSQSPPSNQFDFWDEDEFEGMPIEQQPVSDSDPNLTQSTTAQSSESEKKTTTNTNSKVSGSYTVEILCVSFLISFIINFFTGKKQNENIALAWAAKFATKDSIFEKNFSLLGVGEGDDSPLLLKEGQNVFKFYASGRRFCSGLLATMELKSRHDLISRIYNMIVPCKDEITFEVYMNDDAMDHVVLAVAKKKAAKVMQKEIRDLQRFANMMPPPGNRKWVVDDLAVITESKEVAGDMLNEAVLDQVFGEKAFEKFGKGFISMHFSDQHVGTSRKMLQFKFVLPAANNMADMSRLVALIPYYIDLIGRYKLSSQARVKTEAARAKAAQEAYKELQNTRQEALQRKKAERKKLLEEAEAKLSAESIHKREAKERARQMKKAMPRVKMTRAH
ncbi:PAT complex subunit CCDC47 [Dillenia turbinata]|uniref:PAT complex subunit CCDC47 n=1 Tax=Dillenia turbinata TaxID=194707 RepID=A0AAN8UU40_9MAGN